MASPNDPSRSPHRSASSAVARLVDAQGHDGVATPDDVARHFSTDTSFWLDLEALGNEDLSDFCRALQLPAELVDIVAHGRPRSWFAPTETAVVVSLRWVTGTDWRASHGASYLNMVLTDRFLLTVHATACEPLGRALRSIDARQDQDGRELGPHLLFLILDSLIDSFKPLLLAIDDRLGEVQLEMLQGGAPEVHDELVNMLGVLTDGIQEFGWYSHDLEDIAADLDGLPGMRPDSHAHLEQHRKRVTRMKENAREIREEAKDALSHYSASVAGRQAVVINGLTIVATVFLPLSFITGYFGMNFTILTSHAQTTLWSFILLAVLVPLGSVALSLSLIHRMVRRLGLNRLSEPPP
ncbi:CorA family divalent cation transporter [Nocardia salmonicida]|uniref:CorA family divalent cation transporter n=1 Tax=Nocardia salmonicida TaxID=53431 RepID=UPI0009EDBC7F|nr:CorA family divalent cation transporter [Nocardia salmonicida]